MRLARLVRRPSLPHLLLCLLCASATSLRADQLSLELADWEVRTEAQYAVNPQVTIGAVAGNPDAYRATRAVRVVGAVADLTSQADSPYVYAAIASDCGARLAVWTWEHPHLVRGARLRLVVEVPRDPSLWSQPLVALAWAEEASFTDGTPVNAAASFGPRLTNPQPTTDPYTASGPRTIYEGAGGGNSYYGADANTGLPVYGPPQQQAAQQPADPYAGQYQMQAQPQTVASEQVQFQSYVNLACYYNRKLGLAEAQAIVTCLFQACAAYGVPRPLMASLIYAESSYNPRDCSHAGAMGLCQLMPGTARGLGVTQPYDIQQNIYGGTHFLADLLRRYGRSDPSRQVALALAAYNAGPGAVDRAGGIPPYRETQAYVRKVINTYVELWGKGYR